MEKVFYDAVTPEGLRIVAEKAVTDVVYCGLFVDAGTRDEVDDGGGLAHFCEHASFKGTPGRKAWMIRNCLESVGGDINAYTNKEETVFYATVGRRDLDRAVALLFDIVFRSSYPEAELEREKGVIIDEMDSYRDSPAELIYDEFEEMIFRGHALGRNILGTAERVGAYTADDVRAWAQRHYRVDNATFFVYGNVDGEQVRRLAEKHGGGLVRGAAAKRRMPLPPYVSEVRTREHQTHQAHVMTGARAWGSNDDRRWGLALLNNMVGGPGMNSLLNVALREKRGLVYTVESSLYCYTDAGVWSVYFGCEEKDVARCRRIVEGVLERLADRPLTEGRLRKAKKQFIGQLRIAEDNFCDHALALGKMYARTGRLRRVDDICRRIDALTPEELQRTVREVLDSGGLTTLVYR